MMEKGKKLVAKVLEKAGRSTAVGGSGNPTHWGYYEFDIPEIAKEEARNKKKRNAK